MFYFNKIIIGLSLFFLFGCNNSDKYPKDKVTIKKIDPSNSKKKKPFTVIVDNNSNKLNVYLKHQFCFENLNNYEYFLKKGDTINIDIRDNDLIFVAKKFDFIDTLLVKRSDTLYLMHKEGLFSKEIIRNHQKIKSKKWHFNDILLHNQEKQKLDSLINLAFIDMPPFMIKSHNYKTELLFTNINTGYFSLNKENKINDLCSSYLKVFDIYSLENLNRYNKKEAHFYNDLYKHKMFFDLLSLSKKYKSDVIKKIFFSKIYNQKYINNSIYSYSYIRSFLFEIYNKTDKRKIAISQLANIYDSTSDLFDNNLEEKAKIVCLREMAMSGNDIKTTAQYFNKFKDNFGKTSFTELFESKYNFSIKSKLSSTNVILIDAEGNQTTLNKILKKNEGKIVYIDYWASWCLPCREEMPASRKLVSQYKNEDIVFVYLSIDSNKLNWEKAYIKESLKDYDNNFLILNHNQSNFTKELKINSIPRYLIFDKKGELLYGDAPSPKNKKITTLLDELIF